MADNEYPEHDKLMAIKDQSQTIGEFLEFGLPQMGIVLCEAEDETNIFWPTHRGIKSILAEYFEIDTEKLEKEKQQMIEKMRKQNEK